MKILKILAASVVTVLMMTCFAGCNLQDKLVDGMTDIAGDMMQEMQSQMGEMMDDMQSQLSEMESEPDYEAAIEDFVSDSLNTYTLKIGQAHKPTASVWVQGGKGHTYTSDASVVTVTDGGKVTAVAEGSAYVVIAANSSMYEVYLYNVVA